MKYDFAAIEKKWQDIWEEKKPYAAITGDPRPKFYGLPYPSAAGLHVGHPRPFTAIDIVTRKKRMDGYNVIFPIGYDAFGLPTENYAIKNHIHPAIVTKENIANFTRQLKMLGYGFDWDRCVNTTDPNYYKWTQWIFLQMYKHGLAYKTTMPINAIGQFCDFKSPAHLKTLFKKHFGQTMSAYRRQVSEGTPLVQL